MEGEKLIWKNIRLGLQKSRTCEKAHALMLVHTTMRVVLSKNIVHEYDHDTLLFRNSSNMLPCATIRMICKSIHFSFFVVVEFL